MLRGKVLHGLQVARLCGKVQGEPPQLGALAEGGGPLLARSEPAGPARHDGQVQRQVPVVASHLQDSGPRPRQALDHLEGRPALDGQVQRGEQVRVVAHVGVEGLRARLGQELDDRDRRRLAGKGGNVDGTVPELVRLPERLGVLLLATNCTTSSGPFSAAKWSGSR